MHEFDDLPLTQKSRILVRHGEVITTLINYYNQNVVLYKLGNHLIEAFYSMHTDELNEILIADKNRLHLYCPAVEDLE